MYVKTLTKRLKKNLENNIRLNNTWKEFSVAKVDDASAFKSYCHNDISLVLLKDKAGIIDEYERFIINIAWRKSSYCWKKANDDSKPS